MARWLFKEEPSALDFAGLERAGEVLWDGVRNPLAQKHLRRVTAGDLVLLYLTGRVKAAVGVMAAVADAVVGEDGAAVVTVRPVRRLHSPVTLGRIKADPRLADWDLVRLPRLSVVPVTEEQWACVEELSAEHGG